MNIVQENIDELNAVVKIKLGPEDYEKKVEERLRDLRKKARIPGFRQGHVPIGVIKKMAGTGTLVEEVNKILSRSINEYITDNKLDILGNPIPKKDDEKKIDWDKQREFEFEFELGLSPQFDVSMLSRIKLEKHEIQIDDKLLKNQMRDLARRYGKMSEATTATEDDMLSGTFTEIDKSGLPVEGGITNQSSWLISSIENKKVKKAILGITPGKEIILKHDHFDSDAEKARLLGKKKDELIFNKSSFKFTVDKVNHIEPAELNQDLFDKIFGPGQVKSLDEFKSKVSEDLRKQFQQTSDQKLMYDIQEKVIEKSKISLPDEFLKKWLLTANEKPLTIEQIESEYDMYARSLKWQIIENNIIKEHKLEVSKEEAENHAVNLLREQFAMYQQEPPEDEQLRQTAHQIMHQQEEARKIYDQLYDQKLTGLFKSILKIKEKKISYDDFLKLARK